jgi:hypothetical protein
MKVDDYYGKQESTKKEVCLRLRKLILRTFPGIKEEMRWGVPAYDGGKFYIGAVGKGVNLGFSVSGLSEEEVSNFSGKGKFMRHLKFLSVKEIDEKKVVRLLRLVKKKAKCVEC